VTLARDDSCHIGRERSAEAIRIVVKPGVEPTDHMRPLAAQEWPFDQALLHEIRK
jgi:hypothetical protein